MKTKTTARATDTPKTALHNDPKRDNFAANASKNPALHDKNTALRGEGGSENAVNNTSEQGERVVIAYFQDDAGKPDISRMRPIIRERLKALVTDSSVIKQLGIEKRDAAAPEIQVFDPTWCGTLYDAVGSIEALFAQKMYELSPETAKQIFTYSAAEKEKLAGPTTKVMNKYAAQWMIQFKDEIALAMLLFSLTAAKVMAAKMMAQAQHVPNNPQNARREPTRVVTSAPASAPQAQAVDTEVRGPEAANAEEDKERVA
jgi:hypothetical protein